MGVEAAEKVSTSHLRRAAYLYVRQSTLRQVAENTTSTDRQYALRQRAVALGWAHEQVVVIDDDLGRSGTSTEGREGFQRLVADVGLGKAGIVLGLEVSRLARNNADWHRLLEICALTDTLICDEDGLYDPGSFNDRLVLGLKGTMSEAELHLLRARLRGGVLAKARTGELQCPLPVGFVYDPAGRVVLDPDQGVQDAIRHLFATFARTGSARTTVKVFADEGVLFPFRVRSGPNKGQLTFLPLRHHRILQVLHNPRYAGAFCYGRRSERRRPDGKVTTELKDRQDWIALIPDAHPGYISFAEFEANERRLHNAAQSHGRDRRHSPPREGPALLQGLVVCGRCGDRMTVRYKTHGGVSLPSYVCQRKGIEDSIPICQMITGERIDAAIGDLLLESITPLALEVAVSVQAELEHRADEADRLRRGQVERARYTAELARRRYMAVDPDNRLVADALEADWNDALRQHAAAQEDYERQAADAHSLSDADRAKIASLAADFPALWRDPRTPQRERKRMVRLLLDDVTLLKGETVSVGVRFKGGATTSLTIPLPPPAWLARQTPAQVISDIDQLLDDHTDGQIADILNQRGIVSGTGQAFHRLMIRSLREAYGLRSRYDRLRERGLVDLHEIAEKLGVCTSTIKRWRQEGRINGEIWSDRNESLYEIPAITPYKPIGRPPKGGRAPEFLTNIT